MKARKPNINNPCASQIEPSGECPSIYHLREQLPSRRLMKVIHVGISFAYCSCVRTCIMPFLGNTTVIGCCQGKFELIYVVETACGHKDSIKGI